MTAYCRMDLMRKRTDESTPGDRRTPREQALAAFTALALPVRVSLPSIVTLVEQSRKTHISIASSSLLNGTEICGLWLSRDTDDLIFHVETDSEHHRQQIVCHELAHMILRHDEVTGPTSHGVLGADSLGIAFGRSDFRDEFELAAEALADLLTGAIRTSTKEPAGFEGVFG